jgi:hypothetical protein
MSLDLITPWLITATRGGFLKIWAGFLKSRAQPCPKMDRKIKKLSPRHKSAWCPIRIK